MRIPHEPLECLQSEGLRSTNLSESRFVNSLIVNLKKATHWLCRQGRKLACLVYTGRMGWLLYYDEDIFVLKKSKASTWAGKASGKSTLGVNLVWSEVGNIQLRLKAKTLTFWGLNKLQLFYWETSNLGPVEAMTMLNVVVVLFNGN